MYSYEDRIRAVELYIKLGKRVAETIHQLGYPTENALKSWHRAYEQGSDLPRGYARTKPKYSPAQQALAIEHYLEHGRCIAATTKTLGYPPADHRVASLSIDPVIMALSASLSLEPSFIPADMMTISPRMLPETAFTNSSRG